MSLTRDVRRHALQSAGWRGAKVNQEEQRGRRRGRTWREAAQDVAVVFGVLEMRDRVARSKSQ